MSRRAWRCRNPGCLERGGAVLGRLTADGGLLLDPSVNSFAIYLDTRRVVIVCPVCGAAREFRGAAVCRAGIDS